MHNTDNTSDNNQASPKGYSDPQGTQQASPCLLTAALHDEILMFKTELLLRTHPVTSTFWGSVSIRLGVSSKYSSQDLRKVRYGRAPDKLRPSVGGLHVHKSATAQEGRGTGGELSRWALWPHLFGMV